MSPNNRDYLLLTRRAIYVLRNAPNSIASGCSFLPRLLIS
jgi:hypothetical protein